MKIICGNYFVPFDKINIRHELHVDDKEPQVKLEGLNKQGMYLYVKEVYSEGNVPQGYPNIKSFTVETFPLSFRIPLEDEAEAWIRIEKNKIEILFSKESKHLKTAIVHIPKD